MTPRQLANFRQWWDDDVPLQKIATRLGISFHAAARLRVALNLRKRYGGGLDQISLEEIRTRAAAVRTNWSQAVALGRWVGVPHTIYTSIVAYDEPDR